MILFVSFKEIWLFLGIHFSVELKCISSALSSKPVAITVTYISFCISDFITVPNIIFASSWATSNTAPAIS